MYFLSIQLLKGIYAICFNKEHGISVSQVLDVGVDPVRVASKELCIPPFTHD